MRALLAALALAIPTVLLAPAAATGTCVVESGVLVCAGDYGTYTGCPSEWSFSSENTGVLVQTPAGGARAGGFHSCSNVCVPIFGCFRSESRGVGASANVIFVGHADAQWGKTGGSCYTIVRAATPAGVVNQSPGCPAGSPPDLPWGHVLP